MFFSFIWITYLAHVEELEDTSDSDSEVSDESSGVEYYSDVDQDFDDDPSLLNLKVMLKILLYRC